MFEFVNVISGYFWLTIHRPYEVWPVLAGLRIERVYVVGVMVAWLVTADKRWVPNRLNPAFLVFTTLLLISWVASPYFDQGSQRVEDWMKIWVLYVLVLTTVHNERHLRRVVIFFLAAVGLYLTHSFREFLAGRHEFRMGIVRMIGVDSTNYNPNALAGTILYALPLTFPFWDEPLRWRGRLLLFYYTGLSVLCVILTGSRTGFIELCALAALRILSSQRRIRFVIFLAVAAPVVWFSMTEQYQNRVRTIWDPSAGPQNATESAEMRVEFVHIGLRLWGEQPIFGFGPMSFGPASGTGYSPHNLYVQILAELGTPAGLAFCAIIAGFVANHMEIRRLQRVQTPEMGNFPRRLSGAIVVAIVILLIQGCSGHNLYRLNWMIYGAFQAIALHCVRSAAATGQHTQV